MLETVIDRLTEDDFVDLYPLVANHIDPHAAWPFGGDRGCLFAPRGREMLFIKEQHPAKVWTLMKYEANWMYIVSGVHDVNCLGYFFSETPVLDDRTCIVSLSHRGVMCMSSD